MIRLRSRPAVLLLRTLFLVVAIISSTAALCLPWQTPDRSRQGSAVSDVWALQAGETKLFGTVLVTQFLQKTLLVGVTRITSFEGVITDFDAPHPRTAQISSATRMITADLQPIKLADLRPGTTVSIIGKLRGVGVPMAAREVLIAADASPNANVGSTAVPGSSAVEPSSAQLNPVPDGLFAVLIGDIDGLPSYASDTTDYNAAKSGTISNVANDAITVISGSPSGSPAPPTARTALSQSARELLEYIVVLQKAGIRYQLVASSSLAPTALNDSVTQTLSHANIVVYCGPGDPLHGGWRISGNRMFQGPDSQLNLASGCIVMQHTTGPVGFLGVEKSLAHYRAALFAGYFLLSGAAAYVEVGRLSGPAFLRALTKGDTLGRAFQGLPDDSRPITIEKHPMFQYSSLLLHTAGASHGAGYDSLLAGPPDQTLKGLYLPPLSVNAANASTMPPPPAAPMDASATSALDVQAAVPADVKPTPRAIPPTVPDFISRGQYIACMALEYCGHRYVWGGVGPDGFDCSGLVHYVCTKCGLPVPTGSSAQFGVGTAITYDQLQPGDLVFFKNTYRQGISHVGIYVGDGFFVEAANANAGVVVSGLHIGDADHWAGARRLDLWKLPRIAGEPCKPSPAPKRPSKSRARSAHS